MAAKQDRLPAADRPTPEPASMRNQDTLPYPLRTCGCCVREERRIKGSEGGTVHPQHREPRAWFTAEGAMKGCAIPPSGVESNGVLSASRLSWGRNKRGVRPGKTAIQLIQSLGATSGARIAAQTCRIKGLHRSGCRELRGSSRAVRRVPSWTLEEKRRLPCCASFPRTIVGLLAFLASLSSHRANKPQNLSERHNALKKNGIEINEVRSDKRTDHKKTHKDVYKPNHSYQ